MTTGKTTSGLGLSEFFEVYNYTCVHKWPRRLVRKYFQKYFLFDNLAFAWNSVYLISSILPLYPVLFRSTARFEGAWHNPSKHALRLCLVKPHTPDCCLVYTVGNWIMSMDFILEYSQKQRINLAFRTVQNLKISRIPMLSNINVTVTYVTLLLSI